MLGKLLGTAVDDEEGELECVISDDDKVAVLNSAGFGERPGSAGLAEDSSDTAVAVALSQTLVYTTFFREFLSDPVDAVGRLAELRSAMELLIRMGSEPGAPAPRKRSLILVVREYEPESGVEAEQLRQTFTGLLQDMWAKLPAGRGRAAPPALSDVIDVQIAPLPPAKGDREGFSAAVQQLQTKLRSAVRPDAAPSATELLAALAAASKLAGASLGTSAVSPAELAAALACARAANAAFDEYISASAALHGKAAQARPPETLADESSAALNAALAAYDEATAAHGETEVCAKRRAALKAAIMTDLRSLYSQALLFAKQGAGIEMAKRVANITASDGSNFHADLQTAVNEIMADFKEKAAALRMEEAEAAWSYGLEERMLQQASMRAAAGRGRHCAVASGRSAAAAGALHLTPSSVYRCFLRPLLRLASLCLLPSAGAAAVRGRDGPARAAEGHLRARAQPRADGRGPALAAPQPVRQGPAERPALRVGSALLLAAREELAPPRAHVHLLPLEGRQVDPVQGRRLAHRRGPHPHGQRPRLRCCRQPNLPFCLPPSSVLRAPSGPRKRACSSLCSAQPLLTCSPFPATAVPCADEKVGGKKKSRRGCSLARCGVEAAAGKLTCRPAVWQHTW